MIVKSLNGMNDCFGVNSHDYWPLGSPVKVGYALHVEGGLFMHQSYVSAKLSDNVKFDSCQAVKLGHDIGYFIPHYNLLPPFPPNVLLLVIIPFSSAKIVYARASVLVNGTPAAAYHVSMPVQLCGDPLNCPLGFVPNASWRNTVVFTYDPQDARDGNARVLWGNIKSKINGYLAGKAGGKAAGEALAGSRLGKWLSHKLGKAIEEVLKKTGQKGWGKAFNWSKDQALDWFSKATGCDGLKDPMQKLFESIPVLGAPPAPKDTGAKR